MPISLKIEMIIMAVLFFLIVIKAVNKKTLQLQYCFVWLLIAFAMLMVALIPGIAEHLAQLLHIQTTSNLIYLLGIFSCLLLIFTLTIHLSKQATRIKELIQQISINNFLGEENSYEDDKDTI